MTQYKMVRKKCKDGKYRKIPVPVGTRSKSSGSSRGGSSSVRGSTPRARERRSFAADVIAAGGITLVAASLGVAAAEELQNQAMNLAAAIGITTGAGLVAAAVALKAANSKKAERIPLVGGIVHWVGTTWASILASYNYRP